MLTIGIKINMSLKNLMLTIKWGLFKLRLSLSLLKYWISKLRSSVLWKKAKAIQVCLPKSIITKPAKIKKVVKVGKNSPRPFKCIQSSPPHKTQYRPSITRYSQQSQTHLIRNSLLTMLKSQKTSIHINNQNRVKNLFIYPQSPLVQTHTREIKEGNLWSVPILN